MVSFREPQTLARSGYYEGYLESAVKKYHEELKQGRSFLGNSIQFLAFNKQEPYLLIVSQQINKEPNPQTGHNTTLTVTSYSEDTNIKVADSFEKETGLILDIPVPEWLMENYKRINYALPVFEKNPDLAMEFLMKR